MLASNIDSGRLTIACVSHASVHMNRSVSGSPGSADEAGLSESGDAAGSGRGGGSGGGGGRPRKAGPPGPPPLFLGALRSLGVLPRRVGGRARGGGPPAEGTPTRT